MRRNAPWLRDPLWVSSVRTAYAAEYLPLAFNPLRPRFERPTIIIGLPGASGRECRGCEGGDDVAADSVPAARHGPEVHGPDPPGLSFAGDLEFSSLDFSAITGEVLHVVNR